MNVLDRSWTAVASALVVAIGLAAAWFVLIGWVYGIVASHFERHDGVFESVVVQLDGTPLVETRSRARYEDVTYRALEGQAVSIKHEYWLEAAGLPPMVRPPGLFEMPIGWGQTMSTSDFGRAPIDWYLVRNGETFGHAYFVGYERYTAALVGFIGRNGFRRSLPANDVWFDLGRMQLSYGSGVATSPSRPEYDRLPQDYGVVYDGDESRLAPWLVFVIDGGDVRQIDLKERTVSTIYSGPGLTAVAVLSELDPERAKEDTKLQFLDMTQRLAIRTSDKVLVVDPPTGAKHEFTLPASLHDEQLGVYSIGGDRLILQWSNRSPDSSTVEHLAWLKPDGSIEREEQVALAGFQSISETQVAWGASLFAPIPIGWLAVVLCLAPLAGLQDLTFHSYTEGLAKILQLSWAPLICVIVVCAIAAYCAYWLQRKYHRANSGLWCAFVFLIGIPGLVAYWLEHRRAKLETCRECGHVVPRDRDTCADCRTPFPAPPLVGTEIFA